MYMAYANCATQSNAEVIELNATIAALEARVELLEQAAAAAPVEVSYTSLLALNTTTIPSSNPADPAFTDIYTNTSVELYERIRNIELDMVINPAIQVITQSPLLGYAIGTRVEVLPVAGDPVSYQNWDFRYAGNGDVDYFGLNAPFTVTQPPGATINISVIFYATDGAFLAADAVRLGLTAPNELPGLNDTVITLTDVYTGEA